MKSIAYILGLTIFVSCRNSPIAEKAVEKATNIEDTAAIVRKANSFYQADDYLNAIKYFSLLIDRDSMNGQYYFRRGYSYAGLIKKKEAIEDYKKAVKYQFKVASANFNIGLNYAYDNDSLALYYFRKCIEAEAGFKEAYVQIQDCKKRMKDQKKEN